MLISTVLLSTSNKISRNTYPVIFKEYGVPKLSLIRDLGNIYALLQSRNLNYLQNIVKVVGISRVNGREIIKFTVQMNKLGRQTYLNEDKDSLVFVSADTRGFCCLPFGWRGVT